MGTNAQELAIGYTDGAGRISGPTQGGRPPDDVAGLKVREGELRPIIRLEIYIHLTLNQQVEVLRWLPLLEDDLAAWIIAWVKYRPQQYLLGWA
jgi:hypothetical protein